MRRASRNAVTTAIADSCWLLSRIGDPDLNKAFREATDCASFV